MSFNGTTTIDGDVTLVEPNSLNLGSVDWTALELKFNELNALRNAPRSGLNASKARQRQKEQVSEAIESLLEMAQSACRRMLVEGDAKEAIEGGLKTLKLKESYYSTGSLQLVPSYFHLARVNQYMDRYKAAEEFLSLAQWAILKHPSCDTLLKAELHQTYGLLYASDGRLDIALKQLAQATYYLTEIHGPEHVLTSFGYFDLGNVFAAKANMDCAMSFYDKVKDIWYTHLTECFQCQPFDIKARPATLLSPEQLGEENLQDALKMLRGIVGLQTERFTQVHPCTGKAELVLGLFNVWIADNAIAQEGLGRALEIHKRVYGATHQTVTAIKSYMTQFKYPVPEFTGHFLDGDSGSPQQDEAERESAATKIQALHKGRAERKRFEERKANKKETPQATEAAPIANEAAPPPPAAETETPPAVASAETAAEPETPPPAAESESAPAAVAEASPETGTEAESPPPQEAAAPAADTEAVTEASPEPEAEPQTPPPEATQTDAPPEETEPPQDAKANEDDATPDAKEPEAEQTEENPPQEEGVQSPEEAKNEEQGAENEANPPEAVVEEPPGAEVAEPVAEAVAEE